MSRWSEEDFLRVAHSTKLNARTLAACHEVLVGGVPGVEVAARLQIFPAQISRGVGILKSKHHEMIESAGALMVDKNLLKYTMVQIAKCMVGEKFSVSDAEVGRTYTGPIILNTHGFLVQKVGKHGVAHDLGQFDKIPPLNALLSITYPENGARPSFSDVSTDPSLDRRAGDRGRRSEDRGR